MDTLGRLVQLCDQLKSLHAQKEQLTAQMKDLDKQINLLSGETIPALFDELGCESITLDGGSKVQIKQDYAAKIPEECADRAFQWLEETHNAGLIKASVTAEFGKDEFSRASALLQTLFDQGYNTSMKKGVHPQTLRAFIRRRMDEFGDVPMDLFGCTPIRTTHIK